MSTTPRRPVEPRDDLRALEGYHSPQLDVAVRLNTNESPYAPPAEFVDRWLSELRAAPLHRYPDREARELRDALGEHLGQSTERLFCANGSNEVLQTLLLTYGGPDAAPRSSSPPTRSTRTSPASPAPRSSSANGGPTSRSTPPPPPR